MNLDLCTWHVGELVTGIGTIDWMYKVFLLKGMNKGRSRTISEYVRLVLTVSLMQLWSNLRSKNQRINGGYVPDVYQNQLNASPTESLVIWRSLGLIPAVNIASLCMYSSCAHCDFEKILASKSRAVQTFKMDSDSPQSDDTDDMYFFHQMNNVHIPFFAVVNLRRDFVMAIQISSWLLLLTE